MASDLAAIRAEGRRLLADFYAFGTEDDGFRRDRLIDFFYDHADALLADPAPSVPLVEAGAALPKWLGRSSPEGVVTLPKLGQRVRITTDDGMDHAHWRDGECGGERCLGDRSWANYDDARLLAQLQRVKRQEQSDD